MKKIDRSRETNYPTQKNQPQKNQPQKNQPQKNQLEADSVFAPELLLWKLNVISRNSKLRSKTYA